mmetsp:Transcript_84878/g.274391  ORF Transcript_84878/g.274391 Transcript_84878/m.274391 type:complete len:334 (+) Transcript_84878:516-1517(+)
MVTISGVICFTVFQGFATYRHTVAEFMETVLSVQSVLWVVAVLLLLIISYVWVHLHQVDRSSAQSLTRAIAVAIVSACASAFMDLATKAWSAVLKSDFHGMLTSGLFWVSVCVNLFFMLVMRWSMIYGCRRCDVLIFVPLNTIGNILFSVVTGMVCLHEASEVTSWTGLLFAALSILCGIVMLVTGPADGGGDVGTCGPGGDRALWAGEAAAPASSDAADAAAATPGPTLPSSTATVPVEGSRRALPSPASDASFSSEEIGVTLPQMLSHSTALSRMNLEHTKTASRRNEIQAVLARVLMRKKRSIKGALGCSSVEDGTVDEDSEISSSSEDG